MPGYHGVEVVGRLNFGEEANMRFLKYALMILCLVGVGCPRAPEPAPGGLERSDFVQIAENGFDAADQAQDQNDYAWSMEFYRGDGAEAEGHIYVGTWNRVQQYKGFQRHLPVYPEIRRYRPDLSPTSWETVLDTRDLGGSDAERPDGFRCMKAYRNRSDGKQYLYAGGRGETTSLWRSESGGPGTWEEFWSLGAEGSVRGLAVHNGLLYMSFYNDYAMLSKSGDSGGRAVIYATDGKDVWTVMDNGFGNDKNVGIFTIASFNGWLYAGTHNPLQGGEVWKLAGPDPNASPVCVMRHGGPRWFNEAAMTMHVFQDHLYVGMQASFIFRMIGGLKAADLVRLDNEDRWETIAGPHSVGGERSGFGEPGNAYIWSMCEHEGWFYVGTYDIVPGLSYMLTHPRYILSMMGLAPKAAGVEDKTLTLIDLVRLQPNAGGDLYKSQDGVHWYSVTTDGLGNHNNYGLRTMKSAQGKLFVGMANPYDGLEVWAGQANP